MFDTVFGHGIAKEFYSEITDKKVIVVTQKNLAEKYANNIPSGVHVQCIDNIEEKYMQELLGILPEAELVIGFGGGMSIDAAKYISWKREIDCVLIPTAISVDACYSYPIALRNDSVVVYKGEVIPKRIIVDYDIINSAPVELNLSGVGDLLSCYTALFDWKLMSDAQKGPTVNERQYAYAKKILDEMLLSAADIRNMTDRAIELIMSGYKWVGIEGYNSRYCHFEEGSEHYLAYTIESVCSKHLYHGQLVCLCAYIMSKFQCEGRQEIVEKFTKEIGMSIKPEDVGLEYEEIIAALRKVNAFATENNLAYSILNEKQVTDEFICEVIEELKKL